MHVVKEMSKYWDKVKWETTKDRSFDESGLLKLNCDKALSKIAKISFLMEETLVNAEISFTYKSKICLLLTRKLDSNDQ